MISINLGETAIQELTPTLTPNPYTGTIEKFVSKHFDNVMVFVDETQYFDEFELMDAIEFIKSNLTAFRRLWNYEEIEVNSKTNHKVSNVLKIYT